jgi:hypothetical protein
MNLQDSLALALEHAAGGLRSFPIVLSWDSVEQKVVKSPLARRGHIDASVDPDAIRRMFSNAQSHLDYLIREGRITVDGEHPAVFGVGVRPGPKYVVLDLDDRNGKSGSESFASLDLPETAMDTTASGGFHHWYEKEVLVGNAHALPPGIDVRADGGWVVAPGTDGEVYGKWSWVRPLSHVVPAPSKLVDKLGRASVGLVDNVTDEQIDAVGREMFEAMIDRGGWGPKWRVDPSRPLGGSIELSRPDRGWHQGCSVGGIGYNAVHFYTPNWKTPNGKFDYEMEGNYGLEELSQFDATGNKNYLRLKSGPELAAVKRTRSLRDSLLTLKQLSQLEPPKYLIDKYLTQGGLSMMYAGAGVGKSFLAIDWMMHLAAGIDWQGHKVVKVPVFYIAAEGQSGLQLRTAAWEQLHTDIEFDDKDVTILPVAVNLASDDINELLEILEEYKPGLVVVDTLARTSAGADGNSDKDMGIVIANATTIQQRTGSAVLILHHVGHIEKDRPRGSSAIGGAMDTMFKLDGGTIKGIELTVTKQKDDEEAAPFKFHMKKVALEGIFDAEGRNRTSLVLVSPEDQPEDVEDLGPKVDPKLLKVVEVLWRKQMGPEQGLTASEWRDAVQHDINMNKNVFFDYKKEAVREGFVVQLDPTKRTSPFAALRNPFEDHNIVVTMNKKEANS